MVFILSLLVLKIVTYFISIFKVETSCKKRKSWFLQAVTELLKIKCLPVFGTWCITQEIDLCKSEAIECFASSSTLHHTTSFVSLANFKSFLSNTGAAQTNSVTLLLEEVPGRTVNLFSSRTHYAREFYFSLRISYIFPYIILSYIFGCVVCILWLKFLNKTVA